MGVGVGVGVGVRVCINNKLPQSRFHLIVIARKFRNHLILFIKIYARNSHSGYS